MRVLIRHAAVGTFVLQDATTFGIFRDETTNYGTLPQRTSIDFLFRRMAIYKRHDFTIIFVALVVKLN
jgi:hypothetical protein